MSAAIPWRERAALSVREVAQLLGVSERAVRRLGLRTVQVGGRARIPTLALLEHLGEATAPARAATNGTADRDAARILRSVGA